MKTLILVRHAKSSWKDSSLSDIERPLNKRGKRDAPFMGKVLAETGIKIDRFISSPANRALTTARHFAAAFGLHDEDDIQIEEIIYHGSSRSIMKFINDLDDGYDAVVLFGHNPDFTSMASIYTEEYFDNVPTCGIVCIDFDVHSWVDTGETLGNLRFYKYPKQYFKKK